MDTASGVGAGVVRLTQENYCEAAPDMTSAPRTVRRPWMFQHRAETFPTRRLKQGIGFRPPPTPGRARPPTRRRSGRLPVGWPRRSLDGLRSAARNLYVDLPSDFGYDATNETW